MKTEHGPIRISGHAIPSTVCRVRGTRSEEKEDPASLKDLLGFWFLFFLPFVNPRFPLVYKRGRQGTPLRGRIDLTHHAPHRTQLSSNQALSTHSTFPSETWGLSLSRPFVTPYYELFSANNTSNSHELDVGTFCSNQYKPHVLLAHHPGQTRTIRNLLVGGN